MVQDEKNILSLDKVYHAAHHLKNVIRSTDLIPSTSINSKGQIYLKTENLQRTGSFKIRGSYYKISQLTPDEKSIGVVACSAGNHAQGVALACKEFGVSASIFMPDSAPLSKIESTKSYGANVILNGETYDDAYEAAKVYAEEMGSIFIHPFDDLSVIAGQGTLGLEILEQLPCVDSIVVPIGGGGLVSGISYVIKELNPNCKIYGVQASGADAFKTSYYTNKVVTKKSVNTFADGISVQTPGKNTFSLVKQYVDDIVTVNDDEISTAILTLMEKEKLVCEGAGAVSVAAIMFDKVPPSDNTVAILSGGNIDVNILSRVISRGLLNTGRRIDLNIELIDKPGQLESLSSLIAKYGANVTGVEYNPGKENTDINSCVIKLKLETRNSEHIKIIIKELHKNGFSIITNPTL